MKHLKRFENYHENDNNAFNDDEDIENGLVYSENDEEVQDDDEKYHNILADEEEVEDDQLDDDNHDWNDENRTLESFESFKVK